jgi:hypothetical protein
VIALNPRKGVFDCMVALEAPKCLSFWFLGVHACSDSLLGFWVYIHMFEKMVCFGWLGVRTNLLIVVYIYADWVVFQSINNPFSLLATRCLRLYFYLLETSLLK